MWKNSWQPLLCIIIQVNAAGVGYYTVPKYFDYMVPMGMTGPQSVAGIVAQTAQAAAQTAAHTVPLVVPAPAENIAQVLPADSPASEGEQPAPPPSSMIPPEDLTGALGIPSLTPQLLKNNVTLPKFVTEMLKDPSNGLANLAQEMSTMFRDKLPPNAFKALQGNPMDFTLVIDNVRKMVDKFGRNKDCESGLTVIDHSLYTSKELITSLNALHKLRDMWKDVNVKHLIQCFVSQDLLPPSLDLSPIAKAVTN